MDIIDEFKALVNFTFDHPGAIGFIFFLGVISVWLMQNVPSFMLFVIQFFSKNDNFFIKGLIKFFNPSWLYYNKKSNAVILEHIDHCKPFLDLHFAGDMGGEIWLFKSDLRAFWEDDPFKELYVEIVGKRENIKNVKILISQDEINGLDISAWNKVKKNIDEMGCGASKIKYAAIENLPQTAKDILLNTDFQHYISDESFIFYTNGTRLTRQKAICVHRRVTANDGTVVRSDLRIILTAALGGSERHDEPLSKFLPQTVSDKFQTLFTMPGIEWEAFSNLANTKSSPNNLS